MAVLIPKTTQTTLRLVRQCLVTARLEELLVSESRLAEFPSGLSLSGSYLVGNHLYCCLNIGDKNEDLMDNLFIEPLRQADLTRWHISVWPFDPIRKPVAQPQLLAS